MTVIKVDYTLKTVEAVWLLIHTDINSSWPSPSYIQTQESHIYWVCLAVSLSHETLLILNGSEGLRTKCFLYPIRLLCHPAELLAWACTHS